MQQVTVHGAILRSAKMVRMICDSVRTHCRHFTAYSAIAANAIRWIAIGCIFLAPLKTPRDKPALQKDQQKH